MRAVLRYRVPEALCSGECNRRIGAWLMEAAGDAADEVLIKFDGVTARIKSFQKVEFLSSVRPGDFVEITASLKKWEGNVRHLDVEIKQLVTRLESDAPDVGRMFPEPCPAASAELVCEARETPNLATGAPEPLMVTVAPVGFEVGREDTPHIPLTPAEIAADVARCAVEGASVVHLHARAADGSAVHDAGYYAEVIRLIKAQCDIIIQVTTEGDASLDVGTRCAHLGVQGVEMASFTAGTINAGEHILFNSKPVMEHTCRIINGHRLLAAVEVYDSAFLENARALAKKGLLHLPGNFVLIFGGKGGMGARSTNIDNLINLAPRGSRITIAGRGKHAFPVLKKALDRGTHVRVGLEDTIHIEGKTLAQGNSPLVSKVVGMAVAQGRKIADAPTARKLLGLK